MKTQPPNLRHFFTSQSWIEGKALDQLNHAASLPGILFAAGFPDLHPGKGAPIGAAFASENQLYPHLIGNDAGCGMALWRTGLLRRDLKLDRFFKKLRGLEETPDLDISPWLEQYGVRATGYEPALGTIGGGNHFAELLAIEENRRPDLLLKEQVQADQLLLLIHSGSRALGEKVLRDHTDRFGGSPLEDSSAEALSYLSSHDNAVRWAMANRALIAHRFLQGIEAEGGEIVNRAHNSITRENIGAKELWIHRKGAASSRDRLVIIPGSRGSFSYLVVPRGDQSLNAYSLAHGAGRKWMRSECRARLRDRFRPNDLVRTKLGSRVICEDRDLIYEEAPEAYKNIETVIRDLEHFGLIEVVATLRPLLTYKTRREET